MGDSDKVAVGDFIVRIKREGKAINSLMHRFKVVPEDKNFGLQYSCNLFRRNKVVSDRLVLPSLHRTSKSYSQFKQVLSKLSVRK